MAYRFDPALPLDEEFARVARDEIARARRVLTDGTAREEAVHEARQRLKKLRGLLRLGRPALGKAGRAEERRWRDAARLLSGSRDAGVLVEVLDDLAAEEGSGADDRGPFPTVRAELVSRRDEETRTARAKDADEAVLEALAAGDAALGGLAFPRSAKALARGFRATYRQARRAFRAAKRDPDPEVWHEWRKHAKYHWMHAGLVRTALKQAGERRKQAKRLADVLGSDHDLAVLRERLGGIGEGADGGEIERLDTAITRRQQALRQEALEIAGALLGRGSKRLARTLARGWKGARREAAAAAEGGETEGGEEEPLRAAAE
ncbi:CHAD domain-containing protein [Faunimonas sp. B44]|uniref:CHAD domain-containing protein n=1 Tax=Faunimonas sp. B44 TaxID=3461493 RepID=UPI004044E3B0